MPGLGLYPVIANVIEELSAAEIPYFLTDVKSNLPLAMKTHSLRSQHGFTLVELLVVISIIAVLAAAGFAAGSRAMLTARKVVTQSTATGIELAVNRFYEEYGTLPQQGLTNDVEIRTDDKSGTELLNVLLGYETGNTPMNTKSIRFLSLKEGKGKKDGLVLNGAGGGNPTAAGLYDPWGGAFHIMLDGDFDEILKPKPKGDIRSNTVLNGKRVAVWSDGSDGAKKTAGKPLDDVKTW
jgi:prepilin-type N-terminal cleavage/methylation domain-containing protein